jgi:hypothetical protein
VAQIPLVVLAKASLALIAQSDARRAIRTPRTNSNESV